MSNPDQTITTHAEDGEIHWLDVLIVVTENLRLLVLGPVVVGVLVLAVGWMLPRTYESRAILKGTAQVASLLNTPQVIDPVIEKLHIRKAEETQHEVRHRIQKSVKVSYSSKDALIHLTAQAATPEAAQLLAQALLQSYFTQSKPRGPERERLQALLSITQARLQQASGVAEQMSQRLAREEGKNSTAMSQGYASLIASMDVLENKYQDTLKELQGVDESHLLQPPTLDRIETAPKVGLMAIVAALGSGLVLLLFVFVRQSLRNSAHDHETAGKLQDLRQSWRQALRR